MPQNLAQKCCRAKSQPTQKACPVQKLLRTALRFLKPGQAPCVPGMPCPEGPRECGRALSWSEAPWRGRQAAW